jgi:hypothetical protein
LKKKEEEEIVVPYLAIQQKSPEMENAEKKN